jgi:hypothetical protein
MDYSDDNYLYHRLYEALGKVPDRLIKWLIVLMEMPLKLQPEENAPIYIYIEYFLKWAQDESLLDEVKDIVNTCFNSGIIFTRSNW